MKIIKPSAVVMKHDVTPYEFIEKVGRTCYKSEDRITKGSAEKFIENLVKREHMAMLEHEHLFIELSPYYMEIFLNEMSMVNEPLKFFNITHTDGVNIISGSFRSFYDLFDKFGLKPISVLKFIRNRLQEHYPIVFGNIVPLSKFIYDEDITLLSRYEFTNKYKDSSNTLFKHLTHTVKFVCDRGVSHEFVRHRVASFAQESTRYCNYSKDKFGNEITVIKPCFWEEHSAEYGEWESICRQAEKAYFNLTTLGNATAQEARSVLPNSLKTEIIVTATEEEWQHIINLRYLGLTGAPHPQMKEIMALMIEDIINESKGRINIINRVV